MNNDFQESYSNGCLIDGTEFFLVNIPNIHVPIKDIKVIPKKNNVYINQVCISFPKIKVLEASALFVNARG